MLDDVLEYGYSDEKTYLFKHKLEESEQRYIIYLRYATTGMTTIIYTDRKQWM